MLRPIPLPRSQLEVGTGEHEPAGYHRQFTLVYGRVTLDTGGFSGEPAMQCPSCNANVPGGNFCEQCGTALPRPCLACGHTNSVVAKFCSNCGASLAAIEPAGSLAPRRPTQTILQTSAAERRQLTVMFCDMVGSTALSTRLDPEEQREIIEAFQTYCSNGIKQFAGMVAGYRGDGVLAYFGYPAAHENDAERAIRAGIEIIGTVKGRDASAM